MLLFFCLSFLGHIGHITISWFSVAFPFRIPSGSAPGPEMEEDPQLCIEDMLANPMEGLPVALTHDGLLERASVGGWRVDHDSWKTERWPDQHCDFKKQRGHIGMQLTKNLLWFKQHACRFGVLQLGLEVWRRAFVVQVPWASSVEHQHWGWRNSSADSDAIQWKEIWRKSPSGRAVVLRGMMIDWLWKTSRFLGLGPGLPRTFPIPWPWFARSPGIFQPGFWNPRSSCHLVVPQVPTLKTWGKLVVMSRLLLAHFGGKSMFGPTSVIQWWTPYFDAEKMIVKSPSQTISTACFIVYHFVFSLYGRIKTPLYRWWFVIFNSKIAMRYCKWTIFQRLNPQFLTVFQG